MADIEAENVAIVEDRDKTIRRVHQGKETGDPRSTLDWVRDYLIASKETRLGRRFSECIVAGKGFGGLVVRVESKNLFGLSCATDRVEGGWFRASLLGVRPSC